MSRRTAFRALVVVAVTAAACLDPLYEDGAPLTSGWVLCCAAGAVDTCFCDEATSCQQSVYPCADGRCSSTPLCFGGSGGGAGGGAGGSGGGAGVGGGTAGGGAGTGGGAGGGGGTSDGGIAFDAGVSDGGFADAGLFDAGTGGGAGGGSGGGAGGGSGGGAGGGSGGGAGGGGSGFEFCCVNSRVTTCACSAGGCIGAPFTPCPGATCIAGTSTAICR